MTQSHSSLVSIACLLLIGTLPPKPACSKPPPPSSKPLSGKCLKLLRQAESERLGGKIPKAAESLRLLLEREKELPAALVPRLRDARSQLLLRIATLHVKQGKVPEAIANLEEALASPLSPSEDWLVFLAGLHRKASQPTEEIRVLERRLRIYPLSPAAWRDLATVWWQRKDPERALAVLNLGRLHGVLTRPKDLLRLARWKIYLGLPDEAAHQLEEDLRGILPRTSENQKLLMEARKRAGEVLPGKTPSPAQVGERR
jgi:tetratricopeptide (TPR) repeat protein